MILASHVAMKREIARKSLPASEFPSPWWPAASILTIAFMALVIVILGAFEDTRVALYVGAVGWASWYLLTASGSAATAGRGRNWSTKPPSSRRFPPGGDGASPPRDQTLPGGPPRG